MAKLAQTIRSRTTRKGWLRNLGERKASMARTNPIKARLHFPIEVRTMPSPFKLFRQEVLNDIYRAALDVSGGSLKRATVSVWDHPDEEDSLTFDLTLVFDENWGDIREIGNQIHVRIAQFAKNWTAEEIEYYRMYIFFNLMPVSP